MSLSKAPLFKQLSVAGAQSLHLDDTELLLPEDGIFFAPSSASSRDALLSVGIVVAASLDEVVVHELLRPNPLHWRPSAWCPDANTLFPTGVRAVVPRSAVKGRAIVSRRGSQPPATEGAADAAFSSDTPAERPFVLADSADVGPIASQSAFLWSELDHLRSRAAAVDDELARLHEKLEESCATIRTASELSDRLADQTKKCQAWTDGRFGERDQFMMRELTAVSKRIDDTIADLRARELAEVELAKSRDDRLALVERTVAALQSAQARINEKTAAQLFDAANRSNALEQGLEQARSQAEAALSDMHMLSEHMHKRLQQLSRQQAEAREELEFRMLQLGRSSGEPLSAGSHKRAASGLLMPMMQTTSTAKLDDEPAAALAASGRLPATGSPSHPAPFSSAQRQHSTPAALATSRIGA